MTRELNHEAIQAPRFYYHGPGCGGGTVTCPFCVGPKYTEWALALLREADEASTLRLRDEHQDENDNDEEDQRWDEYGQELNKRIESLGVIL